MKQLFGFILFLVGIFVGLYVGIWTCLVGGLVDIFSAIKYDDVSVASGVFGVVKILIAGIAGWFSAFIFIIPSFALMGSSTPKVKIKR